MRRWLPPGILKPCSWPLSNMRRTVAGDKFSSSAASEMVKYRLSFMVTSYHIFPMLSSVVTLPQVTVAVRSWRPPAGTRRRTWSRARGSRAGSCLLQRQAQLQRSGFDALAGDVEVSRVDLDADEASAGLDAGYAGCAAAHEGIKNCITRR